MNETKKQPPLLGWLWPHEIPFLALLAWAFYKSQVQFRGSPWPVIYFGSALVGGVAVLAFRCRDEWRLVPNRIFFFTLAAVWATLFVLLGNSTFGYVDSTSIFSWIFDMFTAPDSDGITMLIPFVVLVLFWWKRQELVVKPLGLWPPALILVAASLCLHLLGYLIQQPRLSLLSFFIGLYGLTGLAWGKNWLKASCFPFFLLLFCVPGGGTDWLTLRMRLMVSWIVAGIAHLGLAPDLVRDGTQLMDADHTFGYEVAAACSGIRSLTVLLALTTIYGFITFKSPLKRGIMIAAAFPLAILSNVVRLCFTIMVAEIGGQKAGKAVETNAGFITFGVAITCVYFLSRWLEKSESKTPLASPEPGYTKVFPAPLGTSAVYGGLMLGMMAITAAVLFHMKANQQLGQPGVKTRPIAGSKKLEVLMPESVPGYTSIILTNSEMVLERQIPKDSSYRCLLYTGEDKTWIQMTTVLMGKDRSSIHSPYICLVGQGWSIDSDHTTVEPIHMVRPIAYDLPVNKLIANKEVTDQDGKTQTIRGIYIYWYVDGDHITANSKLWMGWWMPRDLLLHGLLERWAYISVFTPCLPGQEEATYERVKKLIALTVPEFQLVPQKGG